MSNRGVRPTEEEFIALYDGYPARRCARDLYRAMYPTGQRTNGPTLIHVEASILMSLLQPHKRPEEVTHVCGDPNAHCDTDCMGRADYFEPGDGCDLPFFKPVKTWKGSERGSSGQFCSNCGDSYHDHIAVDENGIKNVCRNPV